MDRTLKVDELKNKVKSNQKLTLLDVRRKSDLEADTTAIPGAEWRDPEKVDEWSGSLPKNKEIVLYCVRGGSVSNSVLDKLIAKGIQAKYLEGGLAAWKTATGAIEKK